jgi:hypothetical protein
MDTESSHINEQIIHELIEQAPSQVMGMVGMQALHVLALQMPAEKFKTFIDRAVQSAMQLAEQQQQQTTQSQPPAGSQQ